MIKINYLGHNNLHHKLTKRSNPTLPSPNQNFFSTPAKSKTILPTNSREIVSTDYFSEEKKVK